MTFFKGKTESESATQTIRITHEITQKVQQLLGEHGYDWMSDGELLRLSYNVPADGEHNEVELLTKAAKRYLVQVGPLLVHVKRMFHNHNLTPMKDSELEIVRPKLYDMIEDDRTIEHQHYEELFNHVLMKRGFDSSNKDNLIKTSAIVDEGPATSDENANEGCTEESTAAAEPLKEANEAPPHGYKKVFTTFSGADQMLLVGDEVVGEFESISILEDLSVNVGGRKRLERWNQPTITGKIVINVFSDASTLIRQIERLGNKVPTTLVKANEYGYSTVERFINIEYMHREFVRTIDDLMEQEIYHFKASAVDREEWNKPLMSDAGEYDMNLHKRELKKDGV